MNLLCKRTDAVLRSCNFLYRGIHVNSLPARSASPPMAIECVDYDLALLLEFLRQVRRYQPPLENLVVRIGQKVPLYSSSFYLHGSIPRPLRSAHKTHANPQCVLPLIVCPYFLLLHSTRGGGFSLLLCSWAVYRKNTLNYF